MEEKLKNLQTTLDPNHYKVNEPMALHTTFKIGGPADLYLEAETTDELVQAYQQATRLDVPVFIFGGGSNMLVSDKGIRGLVIRNKSKNIAILEDRSTPDTIYVQVDSGVAVNYLVRFCIDHGLKGLETFLGLPGSVGGAIWNNSHFRQPLNEFIGNFVDSVVLVEPNGQIKTVGRDYFQFAYDYSILHDTNEIVLTVIFVLQPGDKETLMKIAAEQSVQKRYHEQPLESPSSGCTFQNISPEDAKRLQTPNLTQSSGYLIDEAGLKGTKAGNAMISEKHANFIINLGGATAADIRELIEIARTRVAEKFGVKLKEEINLVGDWS